MAASRVSRQQLVASKRQEPGDDVISRLFRTDGVSNAEVAGLSMGLLFAGHETTVVQIGLGMLLLLTNPEQCQALREDAELIPNAVEEIMRAPGKGGDGIPRHARPAGASSLKLDADARKARDRRQSGWMTIEPSSRRAVGQAGQRTDPRG